MKGNGGRHSGNSKLHLSGENDNAQVVINVNSAPNDAVDAVENVEVLKEAETTVAEQEMVQDQLAVIDGEAASLMDEINALRRSSVNVNSLVGGQLRARVMFLHKLQGSDPSRGIARIIPTAESASWDIPTKVPHNLTLAAESIGDVVKRGWDWLVKLVNEWIEKAKVLWNNYLGVASRNKRAAEALKERANNGSFGKASDKISDRTLANGLAMGENKIEKAKTIAAFGMLSKMTESVRSSYIDAMGDNNFDEALKYLSDGVNLDETQAKNASGEEIKNGSDSVSESDHAYGAFNKWLATLVAGLADYLEEDKDGTKVKPLGYNDNDVSGFNYKISKAVAVIPGNKAFIYREKKTAAASDKALEKMEAATLRCGDYLLKKEYKENISDVIEVLSQAEMVDVCNHVISTCEELIQLANSVDRGKQKRDRLKKAIDSAAKRAEKASDAAESKQLTVARKLGDAMLKQVDNPANSFQIAANKACSSALAWVRTSMSKYS